MTPHRRSQWQRPSNTNSWLEKDSRHCSTVAPTRGRKPIGRRTTSRQARRLAGHDQPARWIALDTKRVRDGLLVEQWVLVVDGVTQAASVSGLPMLGERFPHE
jgi:hypothetical protein